MAHPKKQGTLWPVRPGVGLHLETRANEFAIARRKDLCKLDGPHRGVDGARCRSPEESV